MLTIPLKVCFMEILVSFLLASCLSCETLHYCQLFGTKDWWFL